MEVTPRPVIEEGVYAHFKGGLYNVVDLDYCTEAEEWRVEYYGVDEKTGVQKEPKFSRPLGMFFELVSIDGRATPRFKKVDNTV